MRYKNVCEPENHVKRFIKDVIAEIIYQLYLHNVIKMKHSINVCSIDDTIDQLVYTNKSLVRFGDGEIVMMRGVNISLQEVDPKLVERLRDIIQYKENDLMISIQDIFKGLDQYVPKTQKFWKDHLLFCRKIYDELCNPEKIYCSTSFSRCYITIKDKSECKRWFEKIRNIWKNKNIVVVEGVASHNGVGNNLFEFADSVERIICPPYNAYRAYDRILDTCKMQSKQKLFLLSLGAAAKPLAQDLFHAGYRVIDIGNLDAEYEMFLCGASEKIEIPKHRICTEKENLECGYYQYLQEIIERII